MVRRALRDPELIDKSELSGRNNHNGREADSCEGLLLTPWFFKEIKKQEKKHQGKSKDTDTLTGAICSGAAPGKGGGILICA